MYGWKDRCQSNNDKYCSQHETGTPTGNTHNYDSFGASIQHVLKACQ